MWVAEAEVEEHYRPLKMLMRSLVGALLRPAMVEAAGSHQSEAELWRCFLLTMEVAEGPMCPSSSVKTAAGRDLLEGGWGCLNHQVDSEIE